MEEKVQMDSDMAQRGRIPIDVSDLKEEVENCRSDAAWAELSLAAKIRVLVKERLEQLKAESNSLQQVQQLPAPLPDTRPPSGVPQTKPPSPSKGKGDK